MVLLSERPNFLPTTSNALADRFVAERDGPEGSYSSLTEHDLQVLLLPGTSPGDQLAAVIPLDDDILDRIDALTRLARTWLGRPPLPDTRMTVDQRRRFRLRLRAADGRMNGATYREIVRPRLIVASELFDEDWTGGETLGTVVFTEVGGKTLLTQTILYASQAARDGALGTGMTSGMADSYAQLDACLASLRDTAKGAA